MERLLKVLEFYSYLPVWTLNKHCLRNRSALAVNCCIIIHCLEVSCKEDQTTSTQREWFIFVQLTDIRALKQNKRRKNNLSLQLLPSSCHCTEELPPILRLCPIHLHVFVTSFKRKSDVTPFNVMNVIIFQQQMTPASSYFPRAFKTVKSCLIYHSFFSIGSIGEVC